MMPNLNREKIIKAIEKAFQDVPYPGDNNIGIKNEFSEKYPEHEANQVNDFFKGKSWKEIKREALWENYKGDESACLTFMTDEAFKYYLPAYMIIAIEEDNDADKIVESALVKLLPGSYAYICKQSEKRKIEKFSKEQIRAIILFLKFMKQRWLDRGLDPDLIEDGIKYWTKEKNKR